MPKVTRTLSAQQAERLFARLSPGVKIYLIRLWEEETWPVRFRQLLAQIDHRVRVQPSLARAARQAIGPARRAFYARRGRH